MNTNLNISQTWMGLARGSVHPERRWSVLTIRQPYAEAVVAGYKLVENRAQSLGDIHHGPAGITPRAPLYPVCRYCVFGLPEHADTCLQCGRQAFGALLGDPEHTQNPIVWPAHEDPQRQHCVCRRLFSKSYKMLQCEIESCGRWYHPPCVGLTADEGIALSTTPANFICYRCAESTPHLTSVLSDHSA